MQNSFQISLTCSDSGNSISSWRVAERQKWGRSWTMHGLLCSVLGGQSHPRGGSVGKQSFYFQRLLAALRKACWLHVSFFFFLILFFFHILSHWFITGSSTQSRVLYSRTLLFIHSKCNVFASLNPKLSPPLSHPPRVMFLCAFSDLPPPPAGVRFSSFFLAAWTEKVWPSFADLGYPAVILPYVSKPLKARGLSPYSESGWDILASVWPELL